MEIHKAFARTAIAAALAALFFAYASISWAQSPVRVATASGEVDGLWEEGLRIFKGIPYAAPPLGHLRWRAPQATASWHGVRPAFAFGRACPQPASKEIPLSDMSEDCLTLNVWSPARRAGASCR